VDWWTVFSNIPKKVSLAVYTSDKTDMSTESEGLFLTLIALGLSVNVLN